MGNISLYFSQNNLDKIDKIAEKTGVTRSGVLEIIASYMQHDYIVELVENYKDDFMLIKKRKIIPIQNG